MTRAGAHSRVRLVAIWLVLASVVAIPLYAAATSPLLAWRDPVYIVAGFAGVFAMALLLLQPLLAAGLLPGIATVRGRRLHRWNGVLIVMAIVFHVAGLWITSPPDVVDALLFVSATPFSSWGVIAMWCLFAAATLALMRQKLQLRPQLWRLSHRILVTVVVTGSVVHALLIDGTMEFVSKVVLCLLVLVATLVAMVKRA